MHLSPLGFAAGQSKKCTNQARSTPILNPPTDFTDLHRSLLLRRDSHRIHRFHRSLLLRRDSHRIHRFHRNLLLRRNSHRFHGFTQMQANCSVNSVNSVGVFTLYKYLCGSVQSVGEYPLPVCSVCSVKSVGASLRLRGRSLLLKRKLPQISRIYTDVSKMFCVFREFCGSKYLCKSVKSVGEYSLPVCSVNSVNSVGGFNIGALSDMLVHFLLWQAAKPSGDKCTPWSVPPKTSSAGTTVLHGDRCRQQDSIGCCCGTPCRLR